MTTTEFNHALSQERQLLKNFALKLTKDVDDAHDLVQDTFLKALRYKDKFVDTHNLKAWLCVIMKNTFINNYRRNALKNNISQHTREEIISGIKQSLHTNSVESGLYYKEIQNAMMELRQEYRVPFQRFVDGYKYHEIADELQIPMGTVKSRIFVARKEMMKKLKVYGHDAVAQELTEA